MSQLSRRFLLLGAPAALALPGCAGVRTWIDEHIDLEPEDIKRACRVLMRVVNAGVLAFGNRLDAAGKAALDKYLLTFREANQVIIDTDMSKNGWGDAVRAAARVILIAAGALVPALGLSATAISLIAAGTAVLQGFLDDVPVPASTVKQIAAA
jgi:hypothetical protein